MGKVHLLYSKLSAKVGSCEISLHQKKSFLVRKCKSESEMLLFVVVSLVYLAGGIARIDADELNSPAKERRRGSQGADPRKDCCLNFRRLGQDAFYGSPSPS